MSRGFGEGLVTRVVSGLRFKPFGSDSGSGTLGPHSNAGLRLQVLELQVSVIYICIHIYIYTYIYIYIYTYIYTYIYRT